jgi:hypothetical protein
MILESIVECFSNDVECLRECQTAATGLVFKVTTNSHYIYASMESIHSPRELRTLNPELWETA